MQTAEFGSGDYGAALARTLERTHEQFLRDAPPSDQSGSVATLALLTDGQLFVASVGNGRCVVCGADGKATALTSDNRHEVPHRGLFGAEQPAAERKKLALGPSDAFVILASDGVWDVFSNQKAAEIVGKALQAQPQAPHLAAKALCEQAYQAESGDNICAAILVCEWDSPPPPPPPTAPPASYSTRRRFARTKGGSRPPAAATSSSSGV